MGFLLKIYSECVYSVKILLDFLAVVGSLQTFNITKGLDMYSYHAIKTDGSSTLSPRMPRIKDLRSRYFRQAKIFKNQEAVDEIVVFKGRRIHGYYTSDFKLDRSKPAYIHDIFYGVDA